MLFLNARDLDIYWFLVVGSWRRPFILKLFRSTFLLKNSHRKKDNFIFPRNHLLFHNFFQL